MKEIKRITKPQDMCIGQFYMYLDYGTLKRGFCEKIDKTSATFRSERDLTDIIDFIKTSYPKMQYNYIAEYNARIYNKYQKLQEQHKKEREDCLNGNRVRMKETSKKKWYNRFFKKRKR
jgi:hypothetical protein